MVSCGCPFYKKDNHGVISTVCLQFSKCGLSEYRTIERSSG